MQENIPWIEKYRPLHFDDIVLDPFNRMLFQNILTRRYFPNLLLYGPPGTGKTTTIVNLIHEYSNSRFSGETTSRAKNENVRSPLDVVNSHCETSLTNTQFGKSKENVIHLNASDERGIDIIRNQINQFVKSKHLFETGLKFVILDEVDYMTKNAQQALKSLLQTCRSNVRFCLICNYISKIDESLQNEFCCVRFNQLPMKDIYTFIRQITEAENVMITQEDIETIQMNYQSDIRSMINFIQLNATSFQDSIQSSVKQSERKLETTQTPSALCESHNSESDKFQGVAHAEAKETAELTKKFQTNLLHSKIVRGEDWQTLHDLLASKPSSAEKYIHYISVQFNIDKRNILNMYFNYVLRTFPEVVNGDWLTIAENVVHTTDDVEIKYVMAYFCVNLSEYYQSQETKP